MIDLFGNEMLELQTKRRRVAAPKPEIVRRPMTVRECQIVGALQHVSFGFCRSMGRFAEDMAHLIKTPEPQITEKQARYLSILAWRYRRQINPALSYPMTEEEIGAYAVDLRGKL